MSPLRIQCKCPLLWLGNIFAYEISIICWTLLKKIPTFFSLLQLPRLTNVIFSLLIVLCFSISPACPYHLTKFSFHDSFKITLYSHTDLTLFCFFTDAVWTITTRLKITLIPLSHTAHGFVIHFVWHVIVTGEIVFLIRYVILCHSHSAALSRFTDTTEHASETNWVTYWRSLPPFRMRCVDVFSLVKINELKIDPNTFLKSVSGLIPHDS